MFGKWQYERRFIQQFYMSVENRMEEENMSADQSDSKLSNHNKTQRIKKSPKPSKKSIDPPVLDKKQSIFSTLRLTPQFGVFQSQVQKQLRLDKFWREQIDNYYRKEINQAQRNILSTILNEEVPCLKEVVEMPNQVLPNQRVPFQQLFRYVQLINECRAQGRTLVIMQNEQKHLLCVFYSNSLQKLVEVSPQQAYLVSERQKFMELLERRQTQYNLRQRTQHHLSEISSEIAFLLYLMKQNKNRINQEVYKLYQRIEEEPQLRITPIQSVQDRYISCLIRKNIKIALENKEIDQLNYYANLDALEQYGSIEPDQQRTITDRKQFQEYMKRKKSKKSRKNPKGVLKTACGACLSPHHEQYNPFMYCSDCHVRFHKYCYSPSPQGLCEPCSLKKGPLTKGRPIECQLCANRGLLSLPMKSIRQGVSIHIFCMLINGLWKFQGGCLQFKSSSFMSQNIHNDLCSICNSAVYTYTCAKCKARAHPLCAYLTGWNMNLDDNVGLTMQCCSEGLDRQKQSYRRKFILNYKKILYKSERDR